MGCIHTSSFLPEVVHHSEKEDTRSSCLRTHLSLFFFVFCFFCFVFLYFFLIQVTLHDPQVWMGAAEYITTSLLSTTFFTFHHIPGWPPGLHKASSDSTAPGDRDRGLLLQRFQQLGLQAPWSHREIHRSSSLVPCHSSIYKTFFATGKCCHWQTIQPQPLENTKL